MQLAAASHAAEAAQRARWLDLVQKWLDYAPDELDGKKRTRRVVSFNDLLSNLYHALTKHAWLADALRARYPAALIDEFQDTDPLQFAIFDRVFAPDGPLFLVGDPKQAIYSFRAADLHTYLAARAAASARYTLAVNQRSTAPIIDACNRVFSANPAAFILDGLDYQPVRAGTESARRSSTTRPLRRIPIPPTSACGCCRMANRCARSRARSRTRPKHAPPKSCGSCVAQRAVK